MGKGKPNQNNFLQKKSILKRISERHSKLFDDSLALVIVGKHAERTKPDKELNAQGVGQSYWSGAHLPRDMELIVRASPIQRSMETGRRAEMAYKGDKKSEVNIKQDFMKYVFDVLGEIYEPGKQTFSELVAVGKQYFRVQFPEILSRIANIQMTRRPLYYNVSHEGMETAILGALGFTEKDLELLFPKRTPSKTDKSADFKFGRTEGILFYFQKDLNGKYKIIMSFRRQRFDITGRVNNILNDPKSKKEQYEFYIDMSKRYPQFTDAYINYANTFLDR